MEIESNELLEKYNSKNKLGCITYKKCYGNPEDYNVDLNQLELFWGEYLDLVNTTFVENDDYASSGDFSKIKGLSIAETIIKELPIIINMNFMVLNNNRVNDIPLSETFILNCISIIQDVINNLFINEGEDDAVNLCIF